MKKRIDLTRPRRGGLKVGATFTLYDDGEMFIESFDAELGEASEQLEFLAHLRAEDVVALREWLREDEKNER